MCPLLTSRRRRNRSDGGAGGCTLIYSCRALLAASAARNPGNHYVHDSSEPAAACNQSLRRHFGDADFHFLLAGRGHRLSDLASSAYYVGGDAEKVIGKSAPWFVLAVMVFSYAVRAIYIESSAMFVRGGVYRVVKQAMGGTLAKLSVSALLFDYVLTGPYQLGRRRAVRRWISG